MGEEWSMVEDIVKSTEQSEEILERIKELPKEECFPERIFPLLREAVNAKLMIEEEEEINLRRLVILSIKRQDVQNKNRQETWIEQQVEKYDCHQNSLVARKKILLLMFLERKLNIFLSEPEKEGLNTLEQLACVYAVHLKERCK